MSSDGDVSSVDVRQSTVPSRASRTITQGSVEPNAFFASTSEELGSLLDGAIMLEAIVPERRAGAPLTGLPNMAHCEIPRNNGCVTNDCNHALGEIP